MQNSSILGMRGPDSVRQKIFVSKVEEIKQAKELNFEPTPGFGKYRPLFPEKAVEHPAKMNVNLLEFLIERYTKEGEVILDPMAGTGSTGVLASLHNRNAILIELEKKFVDWINQAKEKVQTLPTLTPKGEIKVIQGDSRNLSELLANGQTDTVITSPPYAVSKPFEDTDFMKRIAKEQSEKLKKGEIKGHYMSEEARKRTFEKAKDGKYEDKSNIGNLPLGNIDTIITSPPYSEGQFDYKHGMNKYVSPNWKGRRAFEEKRKMEYSGENITLLKHGDIDTIITSPPFAEANRGGGIAQKGYEGKYGKDEKLHLRHDRPLSNNPENISNLPYGNMDTTKKETYLQAMFQIYEEMYNVLKEGGRAIVVVRPFVRNKKVVDLPYDTWFLLEKVGFQLEDVWKLRLKNLSFWRINQYKKNPEQEQIRHEYILVVKK